MRNKRYRKGKLEVYVTLERTEKNTYKRKRSSELFVTSKPDESNLAHIILRYYGSSIWESYPELEDILDIPMQTQQLHCAFQCWLSR